MRRRSQTVSWGSTTRGAVRDGCARSAAAAAQVRIGLLAVQATIEAVPVDGLQRLVAPGSTVIDVGANIGFFPCSSPGGPAPKGRVIAIEPEARNLASLRARVASAGLSQTVDCVAAAAADRPG